MAEQLLDLPGCEFWSGDAAEVAPNIGPRAALGLFDPPYGIDWHAAGHGDIAFDKNPWTASRYFVPLMTSVLADDAVFAAFSSQRVASVWERQMRRSGLKVRPMVVWDKGSAWHDQRGATPEVLLIGVRGNPGVDLNDLVLRYPVSRDKETKENSPTPKPLEMCDYLIRRLSQPGDLIVDLCAGAGPIGRAAVARKREYIGVEYEDDRARYSAKRLEQQLDRRLSYERDVVGVRN